MFEISESKNVSPVGGFFILIGFFFGGAIIGGLAGAGLFMLLTNESLINFEKAASNPEHVNALRVLQFVSTLFTFFLPAIAVAYIINRKPAKWLGFKEGFNSGQLLLVLLIMLICLPLSGALGELNNAIPLPDGLERFFKKLEKSYESQVEVIARMRSFGEYLLSLFMIAILPGIFEEAFFRGGIQRTLTDATKNPILAIILTSLFFSAIHMSFYGFIPRVALGIVLGLIYYYSKSIWLSIIAHCFNNAAAVSVMYYMTLHGKSSKDVLDQKFPIWVAIPVIILLTLAITAFKKISFKRNINTIQAMDASSTQSNIT
jgi:uncharacterized protein